MSTQAELRLVTMTEADLRRVVQEAIEAGINAKRENEVMTAAEAAELCRYEDVKSFIKFANRVGMPYKELGRGNYRFLRSQVMQYMTPQAKRLTDGSR